MSSQTSHSIQECKWCNGSGKVSTEDPGCLEMRTCACQTVKKRENESVGAIEFPTPKELLKKQQLDIAPLLESLKLRVIKEMEHACGTNFSVPLIAADTPMVIQKVKEELEQKGWKVTRTSNQYDGEWLHIFQQ